MGVNMEDNELMKYMFNTILKRRDSFIPFNCGDYSSKKEREICGD